MLPEFILPILNAFHDGIVLSDSKGIIVASNQRYSEVSAIPASHIVGRHVTRLVSEGMFDLVLNPEVLTTGKAVTRVQQVRNGRKLILDGHPVRNASSSVAHVITFIRDAATLHQTQRLLGEQQFLLDEVSSLSQNRPPIRWRTAALSRDAAAIAATDATALLLGETGVGKDVLARKIHEMSPRACGPFVKVDCGSLPENIIESTLFGYEPGSFSGGSPKGKKGLFEAAASGTLFLDEIGELPLPLQSRLLRVLQDREILRVGATKTRSVDVRVIAATNRNLEKEVALKRFRSDLYYRLKVAVLEIPPLRKRRGDIIPLARLFLAYYGSKYRRPKTLVPEAEKTLLKYAWPGNVRELENMMQRLILQNTEETIRPSHLDFPVRPPGRHALGHPKEGLTYKKAMNDFEYHFLMRAIQECGSLKEAARKLEMDRSTLFRKMKAFEIMGYPSYAQKEE